jgi:hypothetical protein
VGSGLSIGVRSECRQLDVTETGWRECVCVKKLCIHSVEREREAVRYLRVAGGAVKCLNGGCAERRAFRAEHCPELSS